jgi:hypothetical protein
VICGEQFDGDDNKDIMDVQAHLYHLYSISRIFELVALRGRPERPERNVASLGARRIDRTEKFDHRSLQWVHDLVAAQFRFMYSDCLEKEPRETEHQHQLRITAAWGSFLDQEMTLLAENEEYRKAHWDSVDFDGGPLGYEGVARLVRFLLARYAEVGRYWAKQHPDWPPVAEGDFGGERPKA